MRHSVGDGKVDFHVAGFACGCQLYSELIILNSKHFPLFYIISCSLLLSSNFSSNVALCFFLASLFLSASDHFPSTAIVSVFLSFSFCLLYTASSPFFSPELVISLILDVSCSSHVYFFLYSLSLFCSFSLNAAHLSGSF